MIYCNSVISADDIVWISSTIASDKPNKPWNGLLKSCAIIENNLSFSEFNFSSSSFFFLISSSERFRSGNVYRYTESADNFFIFVIQGHLGS